MKAALKNLALLLASLFCGLLFIELALRLPGLSYPLFMQPDANLGWSFRPHLSGWSRNENIAYLRTNRFGFRGADWPEQPASETMRIAVLGNSFVNSSNLADEHVLTSVIEKRLAACPALANHSAEVLNFGVSGYGTAQQYLLLQQRVASFRPNLVLLALYVGNDVMNNSLALSAENQKARPYFVELPSGELRLDTSFRDIDTFRQAIGSDWQRRLVNKSHVLQTLKQLYVAKSVATSPVEPQNNYAAQTPVYFPPESSQLFSSPPNEMWLSAWSVTEKLLLLMRDWVLQHNLDFGLVIIPAPIQSLPGEDERRAAAHAFNVAELDYPTKRISQLAAQNGIPYLSLLEPFRAYGDRERDYLYGFPPALGSGHLNATGSHVGGKLIADWLCGRLSSLAAPVRLISRMPTGSRRAMSRNPSCLIS